MQTSIIQVLKLNDPREWKFEGRSGVSHSAECLLLSQEGTVEQVGVLNIPRDLVEKVKVGVFTGSFALRANPASRKIEAVLTDLTPVPQQSAKSPAPAAGKVAA